MQLVAIDFETANKYRSSPCAVGIVVADETGIVDEFYSLINPLMDFDSFNTYVHGITERDVEDAPTFDELWPVIKPYLSNHLVVAHNASFDMSVLRATLDRYDLPYPEMEYLCTVAMSKMIWPELTNHKLNTVADHIDVVFSHHNALEDARVAVQLLLKAIEEKEVSGMDDLIHVCEVSKGRIFERGYTPPKSKSKRKSYARKSKSTKK